MPREERRLAEQHVQDEPFVGFRAGLGEGMPVAEVHGHVPDLHLGARDLGPEPDRGALVGLDPDHHGVLAEVIIPVVTEQQVRCALEDHRDLRHAPAQPLAGPQVERHPGPAPGVDVHPDRGIRLGGGIGRDALFLQVALHLLPALPAAGELPARRMRGQILRQLHRGEDLFLLGAQVIGVEGDRLLHRRQRQQLQQVVLDHVPRRAHPVVIPRPAAGADVLGHGDLDMVHVVRVPQRLEQLVREAQRQDVLHRLLAQVMIDPEHRVLREHRLHNVVQLPGRVQVMPERLLDHHPPPLLTLGLRQPVLGELPADLLEGLRRDRQVERVVTAGAAVLVEFSDRLTEPLKGGVVVELALHKTDALGRAGSTPPHQRRTRVRLHRRPSPPRRNPRYPTARRPKPTSAKLGGNSPRLARSYTAGMSFLRARSPVTPKSTSEDGPAIRFSRRSRGSRSGFPLRNAVLLPFKVSGMVG